MGTFKDLCEAALASEAWCQAGVDAWSLSPDEPAAFYALAPPTMHPTRPFDWLHMLHLTNAPQAKTVLLASVADFASGLPSGDEKTRLQALASETADLAAYWTWWVAGRNDRRSVRQLIGIVIGFLQEEGGGDNVFAQLQATRMLTLAKTLADGTTELVAEQALMTAFKSRCTEAEFTNGLT